MPNLAAWSPLCSLARHLQRHPVSLNIQDILSEVTRVSPAAMLCWGPKGIEQILISVISLIWEDQSNSLFYYDTWSVQALQHRSHDATVSRLTSVILSGYVAPERICLLFGVTRTVCAYVLLDCVEVTMLQCLAYMSLA
eukprot:scpid103385/ scgid26667/ 